VFQALKKYKDRFNELNYGRHVIAGWVGEHARQSDAPELSILDIGCGKGHDLMNLARPEVVGSVHLKMFGIDCVPEYIEEARRNGIQVFDLDIERDRIAMADASCNIVVMNQVLEHTKEIFWIISEVGRILKPGGIFILGVPNLASLHNRVLLAAGQQPTSIGLAMAHVRGFTKRDTTNLLNLGGWFKVTGFGGSNFYPFPPQVSKPLAKLVPTMASTIFFRAQKQNRDGLYISVLEDLDLETPFFRG
jgi:SAM-dependent methyltransferase